MNLHAINRHHDHARGTDSHCLLDVPTLVYLVSNSYSHLSYYVGASRTRRLDWVKAVFKLRYHSNFTLPWRQRFAYRYVFCVTTMQVCTSWFKASSSSSSSTPASGMSSTSDASATPRSKSPRRYCHLEQATRSLSNCIKNIAFTIFLHKW